MFLVVGRISVEMFLLINCFFDATHASNRMFFKGQANFRWLMSVFLSYAVTCLGRVIFEGACRQFVAQVWGQVGGDQFEDLRHTKVCTSHYIFT